MELFGIRTPIVKPFDDIAQIIYSTLSKEKLNLKNNDVLVLAETAVATAQGRIRQIKDVQVSKEASTLATRYNLEPGIAQLVIEESEEILGGIPHVLLTIKNNTLMANAGIDKSNAPPGHVVLLPSNPAQEAWRIKSKLENLSGCKIGVIIADSRTQPLRLGNVGLSLAVAGIEPVKDFRGQPDLYGRPLRISRAAVADNLASAAQLLMGESNEQTPAVIIRNAPITYSEKHFPADAQTISRHECLYFAIFEEWYQKSLEK
jgi:coenzyme F420-0:L-glutamate ligase/coenzyme F420-1:gamma-L-glutamate ligase